MIYRTSRNPEDVEVGDIYVNGGNFRSLYCALHFCLERNYETGTPNKDWFYQGVVNRSSPIVWIGESE